MFNADAAQPTVSPAVTTTYYVDLTLDGCSNRDSVTVHVVDHVTLSVMKDTTICSGDSLQLRIASDGLQYNWLPATQLNDASLPQPLPIQAPQLLYRYSIHWKMHCNRAGAGKGRPLSCCYCRRRYVYLFGTAAVLHGTTNGSTYAWSPPGGIRDLLALNTITYPATTTTISLRL